MKTGQDWFTSLIGYCRGKGCEHGEAPRRTLNPWVTVRNQGHPQNRNVSPLTPPWNWRGPQKQWTSVFGGFSGQACLVASSISAAEGMVSQPQHQGHVGPDNSLLQVAFCAL